MNPTSNKKDFEELTTNLRDLAYLEKYSPSKQQLKIYLLKKYLNKFNSSQSKKDLSNVIDKVLINLETNKLISDELYSDSKSRMLLRRGYIGPSCIYRLKACSSCYHACLTSIYKTICMLNNLFSIKFGHAGAHIVEECV